jgi:rfaE bifunctional protein nucleotidyltransferase chain/domain
MKKKKIIKYDDLRKNIKKLVGKKVLVGGCFDLLHIGHIRFLKAAKKQGDRLIIALESDEFIRKNKKRESFHSQKQRAEILSALSVVDMVILLPFFESDDNYLKLVEIVKPNIIAVSKNDPHIRNKQKQAKKIGANLKIVIPHIKNTATSRLIKKLTQLLF